MATVEIQYQGGTHDGHLAVVELDADGEPPPILVPRTLGPIDYSVPPGGGAISDVLHHYYELGSTWDGRRAYVFRSEVATPAA